MTDMISIGEAANAVVAGLSTRALDPIEQIEIQSREQWLNLRLRDCTASDVASICGVGRRSALAVWAEKTGRAHGQEDNAVMRKGRWFEPAIFEALSEERPSWKVRRTGMYLRSPGCRLGATPDGVAIDPDRPGIGIIQGKVVSRPIFRRDWMVDPEDEYGGITAPLAYQLQTLTEAMLAKAEWAAIAALVHDTWAAELHLVYVDRHAEAEMKIIRSVEDFWSDVDAGRMPQIDPKRDAETVKALYPRDNGIEIDLTMHNSVPALLYERDLIADDLKSRMERKKEIETELKGMMGEASIGLLSDGRRLSYKVQSRKGYSVEACEFRVLRVMKR